MLISIEDLKTYGADRILAINSYVKMFPPTEEGIRMVCRKLFSVWHPDHHPDHAKAQATKVFSHIKALKEKAESQLELGFWGEGNVCHLETKTHNISFVYFKKEEIEGFGTQYVSSGRVSYEIFKDNKDLIDIWVRNLADLKRVAGTSGMNTDLHLKIATHFEFGTRELTNGNTLLFVPKDKEFLCLKHVLERGELEPKQAAWVMTRLCRLACVMEIAGVPNLDISTRSVFINPDTHCAVLYDGWQFSNEFGKIVKGSKGAIPPKTASLLPTILSEKRIKIEHILTMIKIVGMNCFNAKSPAGLVMKKDVPMPFKRWLIAPPAESAINECDALSLALQNSFGPPTWTKMSLKESDVYPTDELPEEKKKKSGKSATNKEAVKEAA
jgi:hypothetical protein